MQPRLNQLQRTMLRDPRRSVTRLGMANGALFTYAFGSPALGVVAAAVTGGWLWLCWRPGSRRRRRVLKHYDEHGFARPM